MLVFPSSPSIGDSFEGWTWNGERWDCAGAGGGGGGTREVPVAFPFAGKPPAGVVVTVPIAMPVTVAANLAGSDGYAMTPAAAAATFTLNKIVPGGATTVLGTITFAASSHTATFSGAGGSLAVGDVMQLVAPAPQDGALANCGVTIMTTAQGGGSGSGGGGGGSVDLSHLVPWIGGTMQGPLALKGVTNGSTAQPGEVGEYLEARDEDNPATPNPPNAVVQTLLVSPGDWEIGGWVYQGASYSPAPAFDGAGIQASIGGSTWGSSPPGMINPPFFRATARFTSNSVSVAGSLGPFRYNTTVATTLGLQLLTTGWPTANLLAASVSRSWTIWARRVR